MDRKEKESRDHHNSRKRRHRSPSRSPSPSRSYSKNHAIVKSKQIKEDPSLNAHKDLLTGIHSKFRVPNPSSNQSLLRKSSEFRE
jgi:hypothetical protein